jgi:hypothetical protein
MMIAVTDKSKKTKNNHVWKDKSLLGYVKRAYFFQLLIWISTIGLYTNVHTGETASGDFPKLVILNSALFYSAILVCHFYKIKKISYAKYDLVEIPSVTVGAVSVITAFFGVTTTLLASVLFIRGELYNAIEEIIILMTMFSGWMFIILSYNFSDVCYFYYQWDKKRLRD